MNNKYLSVLFVTLWCIVNGSEGNPFTNTTCESNKDCYPHGSCDSGYCVCNKCYLNHPGEDPICGIKLVPIIAGFLISFFVGGCGIDHCFMSGCTCPGVAIGIVKAITLGGLTIWWIVDVVFMATGSFSDHYDIEGYQLLCEDWVT